MKRMKVGAYAEPEPEMTEDENWANAREMIFVDRDLAQDALELVEGMRLEEIVNTYALPLWIQMQKARNAKSLVDFIEEIEANRSLLD